MSTSKLDMVLRLVIEEEKQAALNFKAVHEDYVSTEDALNQALGYRVEYEELSRLRPSKFPLLQLRAARSFLSSIDSLIESQRRILLEKHDALEVRRKQWYLLRQRQKSIEAVIASRNKSRLIMEEKKSKFV